MSKEQIIIIDGNSLINRAYFALPPLRNKEGIYTNAVYGFANMLNKILTDYDPKYITVAFDMKAPTFRHKEYVDYKAGRKGTPIELAQQFPLIKDMLKMMGISSMELEGFEADDLIGTVAHEADEKQIKAVVITGDKDALQLASDNTTVVITKKGISEFDAFDKDAFIEKYEITPNEFIDLKGLMGDKSDNIPGVPGVGEKTGLKLIKEFKSVANLIENLDQVANVKLRAKLEEHREIAILSRRLAMINVFVPIEMDFNEFEIKESDEDGLVSLFSKLEIHSLAKKYKKIEVPQVSLDDMTDNHINSIEQFIAFESEMVKQSHVMVKLLSDDSHVRTPDIIGVGLLIKKDYYYIDLNNKELKEAFVSMMNKLTIRLVGHDIKRDVFLLKQMGVANIELLFDTSLAQYILAPDAKDYSLSTLALEYLSFSIVSEKDFYKEHGQIDLFQSNNDHYYDYCKKWCYAVSQIKPTQEKKLKTDDLLVLYNKVELPLIEILAAMEVEGFTVNPKTLKDLGQDLTNKIDEIKEKIYGFSGETFNINSPKQLGVILFEKLGLPPSKKTKTGYSTSVDVLMNLYDQHDIIPLIMTYRSLAKLNSTYVEGLLHLINQETGKVHSHFNQTIAATGRLSSTDPNLQNIPIKQEEGRLIRKAFIPKNEDYLLMGADYSQIELRVLAHLSGDKSLIEAFNNEEDIHKTTAAKVFEVSIDNVTSAQRSSAKAVNFGVIYGMSDYGLSENLNISRYEAQKYIDEYFKKYSVVKEYMDEMVEKCKKDGYVTTILDRKRYIPDIHASNFNVRSYGERLAMNTPIQGSAADIIKVAMINVYTKLKEDKLKSKLILQIHDELIIEVHKDEIEEVRKILVTEMEEAVNLCVPLKVDFHTGHNWYDLK